MMEFGEATSKDIERYISTIFASLDNIGNVGVKIIVHTCQLTRFRRVKPDFLTQNPISLYDPAGHIFHPIFRRFRKYPVFRVGFCNLVFVCNFQLA
jgi:hypothetical protein